MDLNTLRDEALLLLPEITSLHTPTASCSLLFLFNSGHTKLHMPVVLDLRVFVNVLLFSCLSFLMWRSLFSFSCISFTLHTLHHIYQITPSWVWGTLTILIFNKEYQALPAAQDLDGGIHLQDLYLDGECCTICDCNRWGDCNSWGKIIHLVVCYCNLCLIFS